MRLEAFWKWPLFWFTNSMYGYKFLLTSETEPELRVESECNHSSTNSTSIPETVCSVHVRLRNHDILVKGYFLSPFVHAACNLRAQAVCQLRMWVPARHGDPHTRMTASIYDCLSVYMSAQRRWGRGDGRVSHKSAVDGWDSEVYLFLVR